VGIKTIAGQKIDNRCWIDHMQVSIVDQI